MITWNGQQYLDNIDKSINQQGMALADRIETKARANAPYRTGHLRNTIDAFYDAVTKSIEIYVGAEYGLFVEFGTRRMHAHPYLRPALESEQIYGFDTTMAFTNTSSTDTKLITRGDTFHMHKSLTAKQKKHVRENLKPVNQKYWNKGDSNTARSYLKVKTVPKRKKF